MRPNVAKTKGAQINGGVALVRLFPLARFTDNARAVVKGAFGRESCASERSILLVLAKEAGSLGWRSLEKAGVDLEKLSGDGVTVGRDGLIAQAGEEARRLGVNYVGTEHVLLAVVRLPGSGLVGLGVTAEKLEEQIP